MNKSIVALATLLFLVVSTQGLDVEVFARAYFSDLFGGAYPYYCRPSGEKALYGGLTQPSCSENPQISQCKWGEGVSPTYQKSGLGFLPITSNVVAIDTDFYIGSLTHYNWPIKQASSGAMLNIFLRIKTENGVQIANRTYQFQMNIDETPNSGGPTYKCPYPGINNCSDKISFTNELNLQETFTLNSIDYTLRLIGFKETSSSSSPAIQSFISNESGNSIGYLFARITAACPRTCEAGGTFVIANSTCGCNCATRWPPCSNFNQVNSPNCTCVCPDLTKCKNGGTVNATNGCACNCPKCAAPKLTNSDCSCSCPYDYCGAGTIRSETDCSCDCSGLTCSIQNEVRDARCNCKCQLNCQSPKIEDPSNSTCACICANTCPLGYTMNQANCNCQCTKTCPNGQKLENCNCTDCPVGGNWVKNTTTGLCTVCPITCGPNEQFSARDCKCVCFNLTCDLQNKGQVVDLTKPCACRNCTAGECICGNGIIEPGEECDTGNTINPCCDKCKLVRNPCDDGDGCTSGDTCDGTSAMICKGDYKCPRSTECMNITCLPSEGVCRRTPRPDGMMCGDGDLCNNRCVNGTCANFPVTCPADSNPTDCYLPKCNSTDGKCYPALALYANCSDFNGCTINDRCLSNGTCQGELRTCQNSTNPCEYFVCEFDDCRPKNKNGQSCDDGNACTVGDVCVKNACIPGEPKVCSIDEKDVCHSARCDFQTGLCLVENRPNEANITCNDFNACTKNDVCVNGTCAGWTDPNDKNPLCVAVVPPPNNDLIIGLSVAGAAALIGAIAGLAFMIKRMRDSKILSPDTWNPDAFSSIGANPLYKGNQKIVDNRLFEGTN